MVAPADYGNLETGNGITQGRKEAMPQGVFAGIHPRNISRKHM
jgi:hypothetical protein